MARTFKLALFLVALVGLSLLAMSLATPRDVPEPAVPGAEPGALTERGDSVFATDAAARRADAAGPAAEVAEGDETAGEEGGEDEEEPPYAYPRYPERARSGRAGAPRGVAVGRGSEETGWDAPDTASASGRGRRPGEGEPGRSALNPDRPYRPEWDSSQAPGSSMPYPPPGVQWREGENVPYPPGGGTQSAPGQPPMVPGMGGNKPAPPPGSGYVPANPGRYPRGS